MNLMHFYTETLGLSDSAFSILRDLIHERTGLFYDDAKRDVLASKLSLRVVECGFDSFLDYYYLLKYDPTSATEWAHLLDALSVPETFFGREMDVIDVLVHELVPRWARERHSEPLRIWSAACATGEEPLTIAMALNEAGWFDRIPIEIYASDGSPRAIAGARRGVYRERAFRSFPDRMRARYFAATPEGWRIAPEMHAHIHWSIANLMVASEISPLAVAPIIVCRNVFLYFSQTAVRITVAHFHEYMPRPAYLLLGVAESLLRLATPFQLQEIGGAFVYVKQ